MQQRERGRLAGAGRADQRDGLARQRGEVEVGDRGALAVIGERHVLEFDQPAHAARIDRVGAVAHRRHGVEHLEELAQARRVHEHLVGEADHLLEPDDQQRGEIHEGDDLADGGEALHVEPDAEQEDRQHRDRGGRARRAPRRSPTRRAPASARRAAGPPRCAGSSPRPRRGRSSAPARCCRARRRRARRARSSGSRPSLCSFSVLRITSAVRPANTTQRTISSEASRQFRNSDSGSSTNSATKAAKCSRKNESHSPHSESMPVSITFISRPEWVPPWNDSGSCSTCSK